MRPSVLRSPTVAVAVALVLAGTLAGCGDDPGSSSGAGGASSATSAPAAALPEPSTSVAADGTTAPGSVLVLGETAVVPVATPDGEVVGTARVTVDAIGASDGAVPDWAATDDVVHRIDARLEVVTWTSGSRVQAGTLLTGAVGDRAVGKAEPATGGDPTCEPGDIGADAAPGDVVALCVGAVAAADAPLVAAWTVPDSAYAFGAGEPVLWRP